MQYKSFLPRDCEKNLLIPNLIFNFGYNYSGLLLRTRKARKLFGIPNFSYGICLAMINFLSVNLTFESVRSAFYLEILAFQPGKFKIPLH